MGHLDQQYQGSRSTSKFKHVSTKPLDNLQEALDAFTEEEKITLALSPSEQIHLVFMTIWDEKSISPIKSTIATDQTGRFPNKSNRGNEYIMILYDFDSNSILAEATKNRTSQELTRAYKKLHGRLLSYGLRPRYHKLDNELPPAMKEYMNKEIKYQLVPPNQHRRNPAERAIRTFKNHFIAGLCSTDENFPLQCWCRLLAQAELTINLLRPSRLNQRLSAYAKLNGSFNFNATPLAPPGTKVLVYETPSTRRSWSPHGIVGWYVGPAMDHYRCFRCFIPKTGNERIAETVQFFP